jgi:hypothetical protein
MLRVTLILTLAIQTFGYGQSFKGQVFLLAEDFQEAECKAFGECDCCTSDILFLSADRFCYISRCLSGDEYFAGTYSIKSAKLKLTFDKKSVREITDSEYEVTSLETRTVAIEPTEFDVTKCGQRVRLSHPKEREWRNGSRYDEKEEAAMLKNMATSKAWKQLTK